MRIWDVIIVGGGPAGLSSALILGRCQRTVLLIDRASPRNWAAKKMHGYLTRDCINTSEFIERAHMDLKRYETVSFRKSEVEKVERNGSHFNVLMQNGEVAHCRKLLLATGLFDQLPNINDIESFFGHSVFQCPYCDGWEYRNLPLIAFGEGKGAAKMARALTAWSQNVTVVTKSESSSTVPKHLLRTLALNNIEVINLPIVRLIGEEGYLSAVEFAGGKRKECRAIFFDLPSYQQSDLALGLGCDYNEKGGVDTGKYESTKVPGLYVAGNMIKDVHLGIVAAAEGARAAMGINKALTKENYNISRAGNRSKTVQGPQPALH